VPTTSPPPGDTSASAAVPPRFALAVSTTCLLAATAACLGDLFGRELTGGRLPAAPWWVVTAAGVLGVLWPAIRNPALQFGVGIVAGAAMLSGSVVLIPHNLLFAVVWVMQRLNPGVSAWGALPGPEVFVPLLAHIVAVVAAGGLGAGMVRRWREHRRRCVSCGRTDPAPPEQSTTGLVTFGVLAVLGCLPYAFLKTAWSLGHQVGMTGELFDQVGFASPGFGDTVLLTGVSVAVSAGMLFRLRHRLVRAGLLTVGTIGSLMLLPIAPVGLVLWIADLLGVTATDDSELAPWVFHLVYAGFLVWGIGLAGLTIAYFRATRRACAHHPS
jgi:hypothetical protein